MSKLVDVTGVEVIGDHQLRLTFEDGIVGDIDFTGRNWRRVFKPLADQAFFAQVRVDPEIGHRRLAQRRRYGTGDSLQTSMRKSGVANVGKRVMPHHDGALDGPARRPHV